MAAKYVLDRTPEIERLEQQAALIGHDRVRDHLDIADGQAVLDAGCGSGWVSRLLARETPGAKVTGIDITPGFVDYAKRSAEQEGLANLDYMVGDICALPFEDGRFDVVWSQLVVFFLAQPEQAVAEFARVVRPGGLVMAHNINPRMADPNFLEAVNTNPKLETVVRGGMGITLKKE